MKKGTWLKATAELFGAILFILLIRWALFEPYVIPSGSMIPNLLVHDHIMVNKFAYGLRMPFQKSYLLRWARPERGDVIVFRYVEDPDVYYVKRVIGLPGDVIRVTENDDLEINGVVVPSESIKPYEGASFADYADDRWQKETLGSKQVAVLKHNETVAPFGPFTVPPDHIFAMGDNRDNSSDSRVWGALPLDYVLGRASVIWLSCEDTLHDASRVCDPTTIRWKRIFQSLN